MKVSPLRAVTRWSDPKKNTKQARLECSLGSPRHLYKSYTYSKKCLFFAQCWTFLLFFINFCTSFAHHIAVSVSGEQFMYRYMEDYFILLYGEHCWIFAVARIYMNAFFKILLLWLDSHSVFLLLLFFKGIVCFAALGAWKAHNFFFFWKHALFSLCCNVRSIYTKGFEGHDLASGK